MDAQVLAWTIVESRPLDGTPVVIRNPNGRIELFVLGQERIIHRDQMHRPVAIGWEGTRWPDRDAVAAGEPAVAAHGDAGSSWSRRGMFRERHRMFHAWGFWARRSLDRLQGARRAFARAEVVSRDRALRRELRPLPRWIKGAIGGASDVRLIAPLRKRRYGGFFYGRFRRGSTRLTRPGSGAVSMGTAWQGRPASSRQRCSPPMRCISGRRGEPPAVPMIQRR